ncbi:Uncharacterised protein [Mycobacteroides abscessus subsp. massiliense]|nr:Uncharacterised protein [Mycobacteroides abscessus subsp. massiliense]SLD01489.1 Uncharacterised protein [Mycobacteroides abscessus subsp. massiliense]
MTWPLLVWLVQVICTRCFDPWLCELRDRIGGCPERFELCGADVTKIAVTAFDVVEIVDVVGHCGGQLDGGGPFTSVSTCNLAQNDSMAALSKQSPTVPNEPSRPQRRMFSPKLQDVNCVPWSACRIVEPLRLLRHKTWHTHQHVQRSITEQCGARRLA